MKPALTICGALAAAALLGATTATLTAPLVLSADAGLVARAVTTGLLSMLIAACCCVPLGLAIRRTWDRLEATLSDPSPALCAVAMLPWPAGVLAQRHRLCLERLNADLQYFRSKARQEEVRRHLAQTEHEHLEGVLHALRDAVIVTNPFNELVLANDAAAALFGFDRDSARHQPIDQVLTEESILTLIQDAAEHVSTAVRRTTECHWPRSSEPLDFEVTQASLSAEVTGRHQVIKSSRHQGRDPQPRSKAAGGPVQQRSSLEASMPHALMPSSPAALNSVGIVTILHDITRERQVGRMKNEFVSQASHELRTPLAAIKAYVEMLIDGDFEEQKSEVRGGRGRKGQTLQRPDPSTPKPQAHEAYRIIQHEAERLGRMIDNMLDISRIEAGIVSVHIEEFDVMTAVEQAVEVVRVSAREKAIDLIVTEGPQSAVVEADAAQIQQVLTNLLSNAIKYTPGGGRVTVRAELTDCDRCVMLTVEDTGAGIPAAALPHLFGKFYRVASHEHLAPGTGLGLNLVKHIIETVHKGEVGVESEEGKGSRFWFIIPCRRM